MPRKSLISVALAATLTGCSTPLIPTGPKPPVNQTTIHNQPGGLEFEGGVEGGASGKGAMRSPSKSSAGAMPAMAPAMDAAPAASVVSNSGGAVISDKGASTGEASIAPQQQAALKAGAIDDNAKFEDYMTYLKDYDGPEMRPLDVSERQVIKVVDADGHAVSNAVVTIASGDKVVYTGKSYADGELLFHPKAVDGLAQATKFQVKAAKGELTQSGEFARGAEGAWELKLGQAAPKAPAKLDVLFLIDATGSMGGEIQRLQDTIKTVAGRIKGLDAQPSVRYGLVAYRDQGEEYVTAAADFTADTDAFKSSLDKVQAEGGGDKPEDVESGLAKAVNGAAWGEDAVRLVFLVADAAPHVDYAQATPYTASMKKAAEKGIKLFPIGCSGLEPEGEYAFRQMAQFTMGQYLFITRGGDEATEGAASATVDKFQEGRLDDIVVDIVKGELDHLGK